MKYLLAILIVFFTPNLALAYLDPGTGSLLLSSIVALFASAVFFLKSVFYRLAHIMGGGGVSSLKSHKFDNHALVFYSEGKQYHNVFSPILDFLDSKHYPYTYLTSDETDLELHAQRAKSSPHAQFEYIGTSNSNKAITRLNSLRADIVVMTTPQLHVLQIKRSKGVKHYCHIIHALSHLDNYEIFALDYFDSVLLNSSLPIPFIREVERVRGLKTKSLYITGCTYADVLQAKLEAYHKLPHNQKIHFFENLESSSNSSEADSKLDSKNLDSHALSNNKTCNNKITESKPHTILLAPSWGRESLLSKYGMRLITPFIDSSFYLIIRPHPQSFVSESSLIASLQEQTKHCKNIAWDTNKDNIYAMYCADLMIGDFSGVMFDFACLFEKPLLAPELEFNIIGYDLEDIYEEPWVKSALPRLGRIFSPNEIDNIKAISTSLLSDTKMQADLRVNIASLKDELWAYRSCGGKMSALALFNIQKDILESRLGENLTLHTQINILQKLLDSNNCCDLESTHTDPPQKPIIAPKDNK